MYETPEWVRNLQPGDEVTWNDPDDGICTKTVTIQKIKFVGDVIQIDDTNGGCLECFADELS